MSGDMSLLMPEPQAALLLRGHGVPYPEHEVACSQAEAVAIAGRLGYPVVMKVISPGVVHKSDAGGVALDLQDATAVAAAYDHIAGSVRRSCPGARIDGLLVCRQAPPGLELIAGGLRDVMFGPTLMFGLGGIFAEVLRDVTFRVVPISPADAEEMVRELRGYPLLAGARGRAPLDVQALVDLLLALSCLLDQHPEIQELDLNPVRVYERGLVALDARIMTAAVACAASPT